MKEDIHIEYKLLEMKDLTSELLKNFKRYQETKRVWFKKNNHYDMKEDYFIDEWNDEKKELVIQSLVECVQSGGAVIAAITHNELIGFACVESGFFGSKKEYLELSYIHVSNDYRKIGIGKKLLWLCCEIAKQMGAKKLYIAAHPSEETQHFYRNVGCTYASEINGKIYEKEPLDLQMELTL